MVLDKLSVLGLLTNLDNNRTKEVFSLVSLFFSLFFVHFSGRRPNID